MNEVMEIYKDMKANHFELKDNTGAGAQALSSATKTTDIQEIKKKVDGEKVDSKGYNEHSNLPFSHDQTPSIAIVDGLYGKTLNSLKQRKADPKYIVANLNENNGLNKERNEDQLVQHHKVGLDADRHLLSEKGNSFGMNKGQQKSANFHFVSK